MNDLTAYVMRQREWSLKTFGPGTRANAIVDHITKELDEIRAAPDDLTEWVDVIILALDGAWRCCEETGRPLTEIAETLYRKQRINWLREWPDWRTQDPNKAITHIKTEETEA